MFDRSLWLPLGALVLLIFACGQGDSGRSATEAPQRLGEAPQRLDARTLYRNAGCATCHGMQGEGSLAGPPLRGLGQHWGREDLAEFIADPESFVARDPRLAEQKARYAMPMPGDRSLSREARLAIADWMLEL